MRGRPLPGGELQPRDRRLRGGAARRRGSVRRASVCTTDDSCQAGLCQGDPIDCSSLDGVCTVGVCNPDVGCVASAVSDGLPCSDADNCTMPDLCQDGACVSSPVACQDLSAPCQVASCDALTGDCLVETLAPGTPCDDGDPCTSGDQCGDDGSCGGTSASCPVDDPVCQIPTCDAVTGACSVVNAPNGTGCSDGDTCTVGDVCTDGACTGAPRDCASLAGPCQSGICDPDSGACLFAPANEGQSCDDDATDCDDAVCIAGVCQAAARGECAACGIAGEDVCSLGSCGPAIAEVSTGFEAGVLPSFVSTEGAAPWSATLGEAAAGAYAARSGAIADGQSSSLRASLSTGANGQLSFMLFAQTDVDQQVLSLHIDGVEVASWTGPLAWQQVRYPTHPFLPPYFLSPGLHDIELRYTRLGPPAAGQDYVLVDDLRVVDTPLPVDFESGSFAADGSFPAGPLGPLLTEGDGAWSVTSTDAAFGASSATLDGIDAGGAGALVWPLLAPRPMSFTAFVRANARPTEGARVTLDGVEVGSALGTTLWVQIGPVYVAEGAHELRVTFDNANGSALNAIWVDHLALSTGACP